MVMLYPHNQDTLTTSEESLGKPEFCGAQLGSENAALHAEVRRLGSQHVHRQPGVDLGSSLGELQM